MNQIKELKRKKHRGMSTDSKDPKKLLQSLVKKELKSPMPFKVAPMLCTLTKEPLNNSDYLYEIKWDGYRIIAYVNGDSVRMDSRSSLNYTAKYPPIVSALKQLKHKVVLDGEVVVFNERGIPDFDALQLYNGHDTPIQYCVFDILWMDGYDLKGLSLVERKQIVRTLVEDNDVIRFSESFDDGIDLYEHALELNLEGIVAKRRDSTYSEGSRGNDWLKTPTRKRQEFVIGGWAESDRGRSFRSLLFGAYNNGRLQWIGRSGGGYKEKEMPGILKRLKELEVEASPFVNKVLDTKGATIHWVKPELVANFEFATWTKSGRIRKPATFLGLRKDKKAKLVVLESPKSLDTIEQEVAEEEKPAAKKKASSSIKKRQTGKYLNDDSNWKRIDEDQKDAVWTDLEMEKCTIGVHDLERKLWKGVTKGDLLLYYTEMADVILPYLKDRPLSLVLKLTHAGGPRTFIKDMENRQPECATVFSDTRRVPKKGKRNQIDYLVCNNKETLVWMIDLGCVDINAWASRTTDIEHPDYLWLDLDPTIADHLKGKALDDAEEKGFRNAVTIAKACKSVLDKYKLKGFVKTSGQSGLHVYVPCSGFTFEQTRVMAGRLADEVHELTKHISTRSESKEHRGNKVYIDAGQNDYADTLAAPYSVRPYHKATVSTPLEWKELTEKLNRYDFNVDTLKERLKMKGDLFEGAMNRKIVEGNNKQLIIL
jgi:bifunctional non-homologous end joining protein LigD